jgi:hypothetical protein
MVKINGSRIALLTMLAWVAATGSACAAETYTQSVATVSNYRADSVQAQQVQTWLMHHAEYVNGARIGDPGKLGNISVSITKTKTSKAGAVQTMVVGDAPPVPLPYSGNPGDVISISMTAAGISQTWTYKWVGSSANGQWVLVSYTFRQVGSNEQN